MILPKNELFIQVSASVSSILHVVNILKHVKIMVLDTHDKFLSYVPKTSSIPVMIKRLRKCMALRISLSEPLELGHSVSACFICEPLNFQMTTDRTHLENRWPRPRNR